VVERCPSCGSNIHHPLHAKRHARYLERHLLAVMRKQASYAKTKSRCPYCGARCARRWGRFLRVCENHRVLRNAARKRFEKRAA